MFYFFFVFYYCLHHFVSGFHLGILPKIRTITLVFALIKAPSIVDAKPHMYSVAYFIY